MLLGGVELLGGALVGFERVEEGREDPVAAAARLGGGQAVNAWYEVRGHADVQGGIVCRALRHFDLAAFCNTK